MRFPRAVRAVTGVLGLALLAGCGAGGAGGGDPVHAPAVPACSMPTTITVWNNQHQEILFTHIFVDGDTSAPFMNGPGGVEVGAWRDANMPVLIGHTVSMDAHLADGSVVTSGFTPRPVSCGDAWQFFL